MSNPDSESTERRAAASTKKEVAAKEPGKKETSRTRKRKRRIVEVDASDFDQRIQSAQAQGREWLSRGLNTVKEKMLALKEKIKALPGALANLAEKAVGEVFAFPVRIEKAVDALKQKIDQAEAAMKRKIEAAQERYEARRQDLVRRTREVINKTKESSGGFFSRVRESLFSNSRKREEADLTDMLSDLLAKLEKKNVKLTKPQFKAVSEVLAQAAARHNRDSHQVIEFKKFVFDRRKGLVAAT